MASEVEINGMSRPKTLEWLLKLDLSPKALKIIEDEEYAGKNLLTLLRRGRLFKVLRHCKLTGGAIETIHAAVTAALTDSADDNAPLPALEDSSTAPSSSSKSSSSGSFASARVSSEDSVTTGGHEPLPSSKHAVKRQAKRAEVDKFVRDSCWVHQLQGDDGPELLDAAAEKDIRDKLTKARRVSARRDLETIHEPGPAAAAAAEPDHAAGHAITSQLSPPEQEAGPAPPLEGAAAAAAEAKERESSAQEEPDEKGSDVMPEMECSDAEVQGKSDASNETGGAATPETENREAADALAVTNAVVATEQEEERHFNTARRAVQGEPDASNKTSAATLEELDQRLEDGGADEEVVDDGKKIEWGGSTDAVAVGIDRDREQELTQLSETAAVEQTLSLQELTTEALAAQAAEFEADPLRHAETSEPVPAAVSANVCAGGGGKKKKRQKSTKKEAEKKAAKKKKEAEARASSGASSPPIESAQTVGESPRPASPIESDGGGKDGDSMNAGGAMAEDQAADSLVGQRIKLLKNRGIHNRGEEATIVHKTDKGKYRRDIGCYLNSAQQGVNWRLSSDLQAMPAPSPEEPDEEESAEEDENSPAALARAFGMSAPPTEDINTPYDTETADGGGWGADVGWDVVRKAGGPTPENNFEMSVPCDFGEKIAFEQLCLHDMKQKVKAANLDGNGDIWVTSPSGQTAKIMMTADSEATARKQREMVKQILKNFGVKYKVSGIPSGSCQVLMETNAAGCRFHDDIFVVAQAWNVCIFCPALKWGDYVALYHIEGASQTGRDEAFEKISDMLRSADLESQASTESQATPVPICRECHSAPCHPKNFNGEDGLYRTRCYDCRKANPGPAQPGHA